jgi:uncharacterized membrane protein YvbJ
MHCPKCQHENREGARFCEACGSKLELSCPSCGNPTRPGAAFCEKCGASLTGKAKIKRQNGRPEGEKGKRAKGQKENKRLRTPDPELF